MKHLWIITTLLLLSVQAQQLKIVAKTFDSDEKKGQTTFNGDVKITKGFDELNASKVTVYTNMKRKPTKYIALGNVSFYIVTENKAIYKGKAQKVIFYPIKKEYHFYKDVNIQQVDEKKEIIGEEVVIGTVEGKARAKGGSKKPVIMTFEIEEKETKK